VSERFRRRGEAIVVVLAPAERELLRRLPDDLRPFLAGQGSAAVRERLFPRAYLDPTAEEAEQQWQQMVHPELVRQKTEALAVLTASLERGAETRGEVEVELGPDEAEAWLGALNDARLALGVGLGITDDTDFDAVDPDDPETMPYVVYNWLTVMQGQLVDALSG